MWSPTHIQVTVQRAKNLVVKGRGGTNDAFVVIQMGKEKFQTSVKEKTLNPEWYEECDLTLRAKDTNVTFIVFHRNILGLDEFLGQVVIPLQAFESYDRPINKWYTLKGKGDKKEEKYRGEMEIRIAFVVRSLDTQSLNDLSIIKKRRRHSIKELAISVGHKIQKMPNRSFSFRVDNLDPRLRLGKLRERRGSLASDYNRDSHTDKDDTDHFAEEMEKYNHSPMKKNGSLYSSTLSLPPSAMITSSIREDGSLENINQEEQCITSNSKELDVPNEVIKRSKRFSIGTLSETKSFGHGEWTNRVLSHMKESPLARSEINLSESPPSELPVSPERKSKLDVFRNNLRRHTLHLSEPPDLSPLKVNGSANKEKRESPSNKLMDYSKILPEGVPRELILQYEKMNHQIKWNPVFCETLRKFYTRENIKHCNIAVSSGLRNHQRHVLSLVLGHFLLAMLCPSSNSFFRQEERYTTWTAGTDIMQRDLIILAIKQQVDIERQRDKIMDLETYIDNLLVRVMETTPRILQTPYKPSNPACHR